MAAKLLLAEDSLTIQKVFELTFKQSGISLTMVDNGDDAVRLAGEISPDLVVADVSLPGKDGFEVAEALRSAQAGGPRPVLILAGSLAPFNEERFKACGASGVLFKPFESQELIDRVESLLRRQEEAAASRATEAEETPSSAEEPWDFSDVLSEVEEETGASAASRTILLDELSRGGSPSPGESAEGGFALGDFDVSLEDIERETEREKFAFLSEPAGAEKDVEEEGIVSREEVREEVPPAQEDEPAFPTAQHIEDSVFEDSPQAITDLTPAFEAIEESGDADPLEMMKPVEEQESVRAPAEEDAAPPGDVPGEPETVAPPAAAPSPQETEIREEFSRRAQEIFARVSAEVVERVMWEVMESLSKEFSERIRNAVETAAWEVLPATAEALIREEIARIREQAGKESS